MKLPLFCALFLLASCDTHTSAPATPHPLRVMTTFYPTTYFTQRIAGNHVDVICPLPKDADAAFWQPAPEILAQYQQADLIILNGANFERWAQMATLPMNKTIACADAFKQDWIEIKNALTHSHGPAGTHSHTGINGHTWPDPINAIAQENAIRDGLIVKDSAHKNDYTANAKQLENDLLALDNELKAITLKAPLFASHPSYAYLARRYGWTLFDFGLEPSEPPSEAQMTELKQAAALHPEIKLMLWEDVPCKEAQALMDELKLQVVVFNPAEQQGDEDYLKTMRANIARLKEASR